MGQQKKFINGYLKEFYERCHKQGIDVIASFGNDDLYSRKKYFLKYADLLDVTPYVKDGYTFKAYPFCCDYPFGLKTACKYDYNGWKPESYISKPIDVDEQGFYEIKDVEEYFRKKNTIEEDLKTFRVEPKTVMSIHQPPYSLGLDVCLGGRRVGSKAVYEFIERNQVDCPLVLSGHIHESPGISGIWKAKIGNTLIIQPGQDLVRTTMVYIEITDQDISAKIIQV